MKITAVATIRLREFGNLIWVRIHMDEGLVGLGETFMGASAVEAYLHNIVAPKLLGQNPVQIEARNHELSNLSGLGVRRSRNARKFCCRHRALGSIQ
jgi:galactonate dehydratase